MTSASEPIDNFERVVLPFLDDAYTLARYLVRDEHDAQDIVQDALLRALRYYGRHPIDHPRAWLLTIVRRTCYSWKAEQGTRLETEDFDDMVHGDDSLSADPAANAIAAATRDQVHAAINALPREFREVVILRELQELSYREISQVVDAPIGTVMSRLSRARLRLQAALGGREQALE